MSAKMRLVHGLLWVLVALMYVAVLYVGFNSGSEFDTEFGTDFAAGSKGGREVIGRY